MLCPTVRTGADVERRTWAKTIYVRYVLTVRVGLSEGTFENSKSEGSNVHILCIAFCVCVSCARLRVC